MGIFKSIVNAIEKATVAEGVVPWLRRAKFGPEDFVVLDTETTGTNHKKDEVLQLSIVDGYGNTVFNELLKPERRKTWKDAEEVHGITPKMVADKKPLSAYKTEIQKMIKGKTIVGYNTIFDLEFLYDAGIVPNQVVQVDVMREFAKLNKTGEWSKLTKCADYYGYDWTGKAHDSLNDTLATLYCFNRMCGNDK